MSFQGTVSWFSRAKGYGFIRRDDGVDVFVHHSSMGDADHPLEEGDRVSFETTSSEKGLRAEQVARQTTDAPPEE